MICKNCGCDNPPDSAFCYNCGTPMTQQGGFDPYGQQGGPDPYGQQGGFDPYGQQGGFNPYAQQGGPGPYGQQGGFDPYAQQGGPGPFGQQGGFDPYAQQGGSGAPGGQPFYTEDLPTVRLKRPGQSGPQPSGRRNTPPGYPSGSRQPVPGHPSGSRQPAPGHPPANRQSAPGRPAGNGQRAPIRSAHPGSPSPAQKKAPTGAHGGRPVSGQLPPKRTSSPLPPAAPEKKSFPFTPAQDGINLESVNTWLLGTPVKIKSVSIRTAMNPNMNITDETPIGSLELSFTHHPGLKGRYQAGALTTASGDSDPDASLKNALAQWQTANPGTKIIWSRQVVLQTESGSSDALFFLYALLS